MAKELPDFKKGFGSKSSIQENHLFLFLEKLEHNTGPLPPQLAQLITDVYEALQNIIDDPAVKYLNNTH